MNASTFDFHFPPDIELKNVPLLEAWLEIRWRLQSMGKPGLLRDPDFPFALGVFYQEIRDEFGYKKDLEASRAPEELFPYVVRHRFQPARGEWPVLQLGPGVATVNYTKDYTWKSFREKAQYLRDKLLKAYGEEGLEFESINLRYRNAEAFDSASSNLLRFLEQQLNVSVQLPPHIPGSIGTSKGPSRANLELTYGLHESIGRGKLKFATSTYRGRTQEENQEEVKNETLIWELSVYSKDNNAFDMMNPKTFIGWLDSAHGVIHDWFFSLIEGNLRDKYEKETER
jgi:uncharacterized protein (TIGR04255 family)